MTIPRGNAAILLVEDDSNDALFMRMALEAAGVKNPLHHVQDGKEAVSYLLGHGKYADRSTYPVPYLMLLDLKLPLLMGLDVLEWVRKRNEFQSVIILVLTSSANPADVDRAYELGANAYLVKPGSYDKLETLAASIRDFWLVYNQPASTVMEAHGLTP